MMLVVEKLQNSIRSGKNSSLGGIRRSVVDYVKQHCYIELIKSTGAVMFFGTLGSCKPLDNVRNTVQARSLLPVILFFSSHITGSLLR
jgi:hypothetical protein